MKNPIFDQARAAFSTHIVEVFTGSEGAYWNADEFFTRNPTREDRSIGSFHISSSGTWYDHATGEGGDLIDLVSKRDGCTLAQAAEKIVKAAGGSVPGPSPPSPAATARSSKPAAVTPVPVAAGAALNAITKSSRRGTPTRGWKYLDANGDWLFSVVRYDGSTGKQVIPYFWTGDGWREGQIADRDRPLYGLDRLASHPTLPVLVVEGEKCADVAVPGYVVVTWPGGSSAVGRADWSPLIDRDVTVWPDADAPGRKAADAISARIPAAEVLDVWSIDLPDGWDLADAIDEGRSPIDFLDSTPRVGVAQDTTETAGPPETMPFRCLGFSDDSYHFLIGKDRVVYAIPRGSFNGSKIQQLAPLDWWTLNGMVSDAGTIRVSVAQDFLQRKSSQAGRFDEMSIRGAGVWRDADRVVINDGGQIIAPDGTRTTYDDFQTRHHYVSSGTTFGEMDGEESTAEDGARLIRLWSAQQWNDESHAVASLGWALIAPFGGVLQWRPHIWVSGRKGTGKSWVLENLITPLVGDFAHEGSGKDTEAGIRRIVRRDARPVILDEMEPRTKNDRENIDRILALARNASSNHSARVTMASRTGGTESFVIRSCFAFASVQVPDVDAAVSSRIIRCELRPGADFGRKRQVSEAYIDSIDSPRRYRLRIFRRLPRMLQDIEFARRVLLPLLGDQRQADQWAPLVVATWHLHRDDDMQSDDGREWCASVARTSTESTEQDMSDEDAVWNLILSHPLEMGVGDRRSVAELVACAADTADPESHKSAQVLGRFGLRILDAEVAGVMQRVVAVAGKSPAISKALEGTMYGQGYGSQVKRNDMCVSDNQQKVRMGGKVVGAYYLRWTDFAGKYLGSGSE